MINVKFNKSQNINIQPTTIIRNAYEVLKSDYGVIKRTENYIYFDSEKNDESAFRLKSNFHYFEKFDTIKISATDSKLTFNCTINIIYEIFFIIIILLISVGNYKIVFLCLFPIFQLVIKIYYLNIMSYEIMSTITNQDFSANHNIN